MKINHANVSGTGASGAEQAALDKTGRAGAANRAAAGTGGGAVDGSDRIELSGLSQQLRALASDSPERAERIQKLSAAVASGSYQVDAAELSRRLVDEALQKPLE